MDTFSRFLLELYRASRETPLESFQPLVYQMLSPVMKFDSGVWGSGSMLTGALVVHHIDLHHQDISLMDEWTHVMHEDRLIPAVAANPGRCISLSMPAAYESATAIRDHADKFEIQNVATIGTVEGRTGMAHWMSLYRADKDMTFTQDERSVFQSIYPHLIEALTINRTIHLDRTYAEVASNRPCRAIADLKGLIYFAEPDFSVLLEKEWPGTGSNALPETLAKALARDGRHTGRGAVMKGVRAKDLLFIRARPRRPIDDLTARQRVIADKYAQGLSHKEIARALNLAPSTVRNQLASVYEKLAVSGKAELANTIAEAN